MTRITINHWIIAEVLCDLNRSEYADYISQIIIELLNYDHMYIRIIVL